MANNSLDGRFFSNTYVTGGGRQNYLRIEHLEDPLFTSFTFDIDFISSPLFYTINYSDYGYPNVEGMGDRIESSLKDMYEKNISIDEGYDILPQLSASILDDNKLGFGLQQNVYMDMPLYGATEYIYMVDKRNGGADQNDVRYDNNNFGGSIENPNGLNGYKLGDSVKTVVNDSDKEWAERKLQQNQEQVSICDEIMNDPSVVNEHKKNEEEMNSAMLECNQNNKVRVDGKEYTESELQQEIDKLKNEQNEFEQFKREIVDWANGEMAQYQNRVTNAYMGNKCVQKIATYDNIAICGEDQLKVYKDELTKQFGDYTKNYISGSSKAFLDMAMKVYDDLKIFLEIKKDVGRCDIKQSKIIEKFKSKLVYFKICKQEDKSFTGKIEAIPQKDVPDWLNKVCDGISRLVGKKDEIEKLKCLMQFQCDKETSFSEFESTVTNKNDNELAKYEAELESLRVGLYGRDSSTNAPCEMSNASPDSPYGRYMEAKDKYENDEYSQAEKSKSLAKSGASEMSNMISTDEYMQSEMNNNYNNSVQTSAQPTKMSRTKSAVASQTVLDMLGFISGMKKMIMGFPYIIQGITGLDTAYNKHYMIKDPYLGSGEDKITLTCLESLDLRVSSMFNRYFNAVYDRQYRRERVPLNLRRFNCSVYVHDVRNFVSISRLNPDGSQKTSYNRLLELTDMYYSVIEFRFFDCEIVPEETGNIFDNISNEAPSEMKKTNFTFTYGNCVVNFVPQSEVIAHNSGI